MAPSASGATRTGKVFKVIDGDSVRVVVKKKTVTVNLLGIRADDGCIADAATAKLRSLLKRKAKVRLVSDGSRKGAYVFRGTKLINREMLLLGLAEVSNAGGLRQGALLTSAQDIAKGAGRGMWGSECTGVPDPVNPNPNPSPSPSPTPTPTPGPEPVDSAANRAEFDKVLRGFKFVVHDSQSGSFGFTQDKVFHWCKDGHFTYERTLVSDAGNEYEREDGTWKVSNVTVRSGQNIEGNVDVTSGPQGQTPTQGFIYGGLTADGTGFIRVNGTNGENRLASRSADNFC
jgi:endonuclease YncB( thermonuclease family)